MIKEFFLDKFAYDLQCNRLWIDVCNRNEDEIDGFIKRSFSHLINAHHRWICLLEGIEPESGLNDEFALRFWLELCNDNYRKTENYLENRDLNEKIGYHNEEGIKLEKEVIDILYPILNHSNHHRAQISREIRVVGIEPPAFNFIAFH